MPRKPKTAKPKIDDLPANPGVFTTGSLAGVMCPWCIESISHRYLFMPTGMMSARCPHCEQLITLNTRTLLIVQQGAVDPHLAFVLRKELK